MTRRLMAGIALMIAGGTLIVLSAVIALANIEKPTSWTLTTLRIVGLFLLAVASIIVALAKQDKKVKEAVKEQVEPLANPSGLWVSDRISMHTHKKTESSLK